MATTRERGIAPGSYVAIVYVDEKSIDFVDPLDLKAGDDKTVSFDMTRKEYLDKMTPEEKKQLEEFKKKNADVVAANSKIANLNALLTQARTDTKAGNYDSAIKAMTDATAAKPDEPPALDHAGRCAVGLGGCGGKGSQDSRYVAFGSGDSAEVFRCGDLLQEGDRPERGFKKPSVETAAAAYNQLGQAYGKAGNGTDSAAAYEMAAKTSPANAGMYYFNEAATLYNAGNLDGGGRSSRQGNCSRSQEGRRVLHQGAGADSEGYGRPEDRNKIVAPDGCVEAYQTYLELAPDGPHAADVKGILTGIGASVTSTYKAGGKKK